MIGSRFFRGAVLVLALGVSLAAGATAITDNLLPFPANSLGPRQLAVVANEADPDSLEIARYYLDKRHIPEENLIRVRFPAGESSLPRERFDALRQEVASRTPAHIQGYALAWTLPFRVDCMSITAAFAFGFDPAYCSARRCARTRPSPLFKSSSRAPYQDFRMRPAMLLAGRNLNAVKQLIDRGVAADSSYPPGTGYLVNTPDTRRSVRSYAFDLTLRQLGDAVRLERFNGVGIRDKKDVLFYFTGLTHVPYLDSLEFRPGALADHLTSSGGVLLGGKQMSALRWLDAGATASYGTVLEPCNHTGKFPFPAVAIWFYTDGETALEAYWKSVEQPGEGVFVGDPLAAPFAPKVHPLPGGAEVELVSPEARILWVTHAETPVGPYLPTTHAYNLAMGYSRTRVELPQQPGYFRLELVTGQIVPTAAPPAGAAKAVPKSPAGGPAR